MGQLIRIRRGTKEDLSKIKLAEAELGFTTDTREVYVGDGDSNLFVGKVLFDTLANRPLASSSGRLFYASDNGKLYLDIGVWVAISFASLDGVPDGTTYGKVKLATLTGGIVNQIATTGAMLTGDQINIHLTNLDKHRVIDDSGASEVGLWSSIKIDATKMDKALEAIEGNLSIIDLLGNAIDSGYKISDSETTAYNLLSAAKIYQTIDDRLSGLNWQDSAILFLLSDLDSNGEPPGNPAIGAAYIVNNWGAGFTDEEVREWDGSQWVLIKTLEQGDRFIIGIQASGSFASQDSNIATYNTEWTFTTPSEGWAILLTGDGSIYENNGYTFTDTTWIQFTGAGQIIAGLGLDKIGNTLHAKFGAGITEKPVDYIGLDLEPSEGLRLTTLDETAKLAVDYDGSTIGIVATKLALLSNSIMPGHLNSSVAGEGLTGGNGLALRVNTGNGLQVVDNQVVPKLKILGGVKIDEEGFYVDLTDLGFNYVDGHLVINAGSFV